MTSATRTCLRENSPTSENTTQETGNQLPVMSDIYDFESCCYTKTRKVRGKLVWKIDDFSRRTEKLTSSVFSTPEPNKSDWMLLLYPMGEYAESKDPFVSIFIFLGSSEETWATAIFSLIDEEGRVRNTLNTRNHKFTPKFGKGFSNFVKRNYVLDKTNVLLPNDELTIVCEIEVLLGSANVTVEELAPWATTGERPSLLARDLGTLLASESLCDVTIVAGEEGVELRAHKLILSARSPVFAAMFRNEMAESEQSVVRVADVDADVFREMLEHIYTDKCEVSRPGELLAAADRYQLDGLEDRCEEALCKTLAVGNVLEKLALAEIYSCSRLRDCAIRFFAQHRSDVIKSPDWETFKGGHQSVVTEMFEKMSL